MTFATAIQQKFKLHILSLLEMLKAYG